MKNKTSMSLDEYEREHPELAKKAYDILAEHQNILNYLILREDITVEAVDRIVKKEDLQSRVIRATEPNRSPTTPYIPVLDGSYDNASEPQKKAYDIQVDREIDSIFGSYIGTDEFSNRMKRYQEAVKDRPRVFTLTKEEFDKSKKDMWLVHEG